MTETADEIAALRRDAERYRFLRSEHATEADPIVWELWNSLRFKLCRLEAMDGVVDMAMRMLRR